MPLRRPRIPGGWGRDRRERRRPDGAAKADRSAANELARLRAIIDHGTSAIIALNEDGAIHTVNPMAERLFGWRADELVGEPADRIFLGAGAAPDEGASLWRRLKGAGRLIEIDLPRSDGKWFPAEAAVVTVRAGGGGASFDTLIARDLSERRAIEAALRSAQTAMREQAERAAGLADTRLRDLLSNTQQGVVMTDQADRVVLVNGAFIDLYMSRLPYHQRRESSWGGLPFRRLCEAIAGSGAIVTAAGDQPASMAEGWCAQRSSCDGKGIVHDLADGRHVIAATSRMHDGGFLTIVTDISEAIHRDNELTLIADNLPVLIAYADQDERTRFFNRTGEQWYRRRADQVLGRKLGEVMPAELYDRLRPVIGAVLKGEPQRVEYRANYPDGKTRWVEARYVPNVDAAGIVHGFFAVSIDMSESVRKAKELAIIADSLPGFVGYVDASERYRWINRTAEEWIGRPAADVIGKTLKEVLLPDHYERLYPHVQAVLAGKPQTWEYEVPYPDGSQRWSEARLIPDVDANGKVLGYFGLVLDVTQRHVAETQLAQAQKMEAVGQLTAGIAHDFNNLLGVVLGNLDLVSLQLADHPREADMLRRAIEAAEKGASLTQRLLSFSRRQTLLTRECDVNDLVGGMSELLVHTIGAAITVRAALAEGLWVALVDSTQLENAILNLAINAKDAMPDGGVLTIETANAELDEAAAARHADARPGDYVVIKVSDTGVGMTPEVIRRAVEPFFTTKGVGKGTGLGLSMVYGFVKQSGGHVQIESEPGRGTTVWLYLPRAAATAETQSRRELRNAEPLAALRSA